VAIGPGGDQLGVLRSCDSRQELVQAITVGSGKWGQEVILNALDDFSRRNEPVSPRSSQVNLVSAPVGRGPSPQGESLSFKLIDEIDHSRFVGIQYLDQLLLDHIAALGEEGEHCDVRDHQVHRAQRFIEGGAQPAMGALE